MKYCLTVTQLMVCVQNENGIDGAVRKVRIIRRSNDNPDVALALNEGSDTKELQRQISKIDGDDFAFRANLIRQLQREVSSTGAEINDNVSVSDIQSANDVRGTLPSVPI